MEVEAPYEYGQKDEEQGHEDDPIDVTQAEMLLVVTGRSCVPVQSQV